MLSTTTLNTFKDPRHMPGYAGYRPQAKFSYHGDTFGNATARYFQDRRTAEFTTSVMKLQGVSGDGKHEFPTVYSNNQELVLSARTRTRERWHATPEYSLFNRHERGRQVQQFDKHAQSHRDHYMDKSGTVQRVDQLLVPRNGDSTTYCVNPAENSPLFRGVKLKCPLCGKIVPPGDKDFMARHHMLPSKMSPPTTCTWRDRAIRDVYFEKR